jgi:probable HAF family extracellular repeat protein
MKPKTLTLLLTLVFVATSSAFAGTTFTPTGVIDMLPTSMSDDASIVVGTGFFQVPNLYYTEAGGAVVIGDGCFNGLPSISGDGTTVLGCHVDAQGNENAAKWLGGTSWQDLGSEAGAVPCGTSLSGPWGVNQDGSLAVGLLWRAQVCHANAGFWDLVNGGPATVLPMLFDGPSSRANGVNADGSVIVGWQDQPNGERTAAKWVNGVEELILTPSGGFNGEAQAVSADGNAIVGGGYNLREGAWIWRPATGVQRIEGKKGQSFILLDVSDDGKTGVGFTREGAHGGHQRAFLWRDGRGAIILAKYLADRGAVVPEGWDLIVASLISADGNTVYGWGFNPDNLVEMFKVELQ